MFGNSNVSHTPVDDIYSSQADTYGNSFQNPINPANMNPGWGIDPSLLSPSYSAGYRPQYNGPQGYARYENPGFFKAVSNLLPTSPDVTWGNPFMHQKESIDSVANKPMDGFMWGAQRIAAPIAAYALGRKLVSSTGIGWGMGSKFGAGMGDGMASAFGMKSAFGGAKATASAVKGAYAAEGISGAFGAIKTVGFGGAANLASRGLMGAAVGATAWAAMPLLAGQAVMKTLEKGVFDPYINTRKSAEDLRNNFSGVTMPDARGNASTGGGLGYSESTKIAEQITQQGIGDMTFSNEQYRQGADMAARAGLLDSTKTKGIARAVKDSMEQVKLIMSIANMPEMKDAIEELAKLQRAGASTVGGINSSAANSFRQIGGFAAQAGISVSKMLNTVGAQGQYLYQANGMTPYLGQMAAGNAYAAFSAGKRMGVIGTEQMARMGGPEGAAQASLTGQINGSQTTFNQMALLMHGNKQGSAYGTSDATNITSRFGAVMSEDPLGGYGSMILYGRQLAGKQMEGRGSRAIQDQLMSIAKNIPGAIGKNGKISAEHAAPLLQNMGFDKDAIQAYMAQVAAESDPETLQLRLKALRKNTIEQESEYVSQQGIYGGAIGGSIYNVRKGGRAFTKAVSRNFSEPFSYAAGKAGDWTQQASNWAWYGSTLRTDRHDDTDAYLGTNNTSPVKVGDKKFDLSRESQRIDFSDAKYFKVTKKLNNLLLSGNESASKYFKAEKPEERSEILRGMIRKGDLGKDVTENLLGKDVSENIRTLKKLDSYAENLTKGTVGAYELRPETEDRLNKDLDYITHDYKGKDSDKMYRISLAEKITDKMAKGEISEVSSNGELLKDKDVAEYYKIMGFKDASEVLRDSRIVYRRAASKSLLRVSDEYTNRKASNQWSDGNLKAEYEKVKKTDPEKAERIRMKDTAQAMGGIHQGGLKNAMSLEVDEIQGAEQISKNEMKMRNSLNDALKEGRIDVEGYVNKTAALDMGKAVKLFDKAVDKFIKKANSDGTDGGDNTPWTWGTLDSKLGRAVGWSSKNMGDASGNATKK